MARHFATAQHRAVSTQLANLVKFVTDIEHAATIGGELAQGYKKFAHRLRRQHRGWLVKNQNFRIREQRAHDLHSLTLTNGERMHGPIWLDVETINFCLAYGLFAHGI